jgi:hypothetical protein
MHSASTCCLRDDPLTDSEIDPESINCNLNPDSNRSLDSRPPHASRIAFMLRAFSYRTTGCSSDRSLAVAAGFDDGHELACLQADRLGYGAWGRGIRGPDSRLRDGAVRGSVSRPVGPSSRAGRDAEHLDAAIICPRASHADGSCNRAVDCRAERRSGCRECSTCLRARRS